MATHITRPAPGATTPGRRRRRRALKAFATLTAFALLAGACGDDDEGSAPAEAEAGADEGGSSSGDPLAPQPLDERSEVVFGTTFASIEAFSQLQLAQFTGELEKENLELRVEIVPFTEGILLLESGEIDIFPYSLSPVLFNAISGGSGVRLVTSTGAYPEDAKTGYWATPDFVEAFESCDFDDVRWSTGGSAGLTGVAVLPLAEHLRDECDGMTVADLPAPLLIGGGELVAAMETGGADLGFLFDPTWAVAEQDGLAEQVLAFPAGVHTAGYAMSEQRNDDPELTDAILRALLRTTRTYLEGDYRQDEDVRSFLVEEMEVAEADVDLVPSGTFDQDLAFDDSAVEPLQELWLESGDFLDYDEPMALEDVYDDGPIRRVLGD